MIINSRSIHNFRKFTDLLILNFAFIAAGIMAQSADILLERNFIFILLAIENLVWLAASNPLKIYEDFYTRSASVHSTIIFKSVLLILITDVLFLFLFKENLFTRNFIFINTSLTFVLIIFKEIVFRVLQKKYRKKDISLRKILIIGAGELGCEFKDFLLSNPSFGYSFTGFLDDFENSADVLGKTEVLEETIASKNIDDVVIALPVTQYSQLDSLMKICDRKAVKSYIIPDYSKLHSNKFKINLFGNFPVITVRNNPLEEIQWRWLKRTVDILFSGLAAVFILWWLLPVISILIRISSKGPAFFIQERVGFNNQIFKCYKFRTMNLAASADKNSDKPVTDDDDRITKIGKILRKTNLDEIPQFINVLKGDMSIVGPRPHAIPFQNAYSGIVDEIRLRHRVLPGITGWAQIHGLRGDVDDEEEKKIRTKKRIEYDIWYIENWSIWLDFQIIFETVWQVFTGRNTGN
ncbi:MAG: undecaprenyl-phosphate glucose phosphotransferase [Ignavibacteria bacterium]|nr:undecaprenyl-phosphate glucose phosphotransferase [Ignavibacteria bacterium]